MSDALDLRVAAADLSLLLAERLQRPQRHRLLQGYPAMPQMLRAAPSHQGRADGVRQLDGALVTARDTARQSLQRLQLQLMSPPPWRTEEQRARYETQIRPHNVKLVDELTGLLQTPDPAQPSFVQVDRSRDLIVGVIPHTQCTPKVHGCGFCTFPHDANNKHARAAVVGAVHEEIDALLGHNDALLGRSVNALYFGGGTANLAKPEQIASLFGTLSKHLQLADAEVSLEGIPSLFASWFFAPLKMLQALPVAARRISMGIQSFDGPTLQAMGRSAFGDLRSIAKLVRRAQAMGISTSGDFLYNLPGQTQAAMLSDVRSAVELGLEQICLYNLVLYDGLGTLWSNDPDRLAAMPSNEAGCASWIALRDCLLGAGYVQTTLTNFERQDVADGPRAFRYERLSFSPEKTDALGFGPLSLSALVDPVARRAVKLQRSKNLREPAFSGDDLYFPLEGEDLRLFFVTRSLSKGTMDRAVYQRFFGSDLLADLGTSLGVLAEAGLVVVSDDRVDLTPRGMFFSDAAVATLVATRVRRGDAAGVRTREALGAQIRLPSYDGMG